MKNEKRNLKKSVLFMISIVLTGTILTGCGTQEVEQVMSTKVLVEAAVPASGELVLQNQFVGTVSPQEAIYVIPKVAGEVTETYVEVGQQIKAGKALCKIDDKAARLQLANAEATYQTATANANQALGSSMDLQYIQMEANRDNLVKQKEDYNKKIDDARQDLSELRQNEADAKKQMENAENAYKGASKDYITMQAIKSKLSPLVLEPLAAEGITSQTALGAAIKTTEKTIATLEATTPQDPAAIAAAKAKLGMYQGYQKALSEAGVTIDSLSDANLALLKSGVDMQAPAISSASSATASIKSGISSMESAIEQYKSAADQTQDGIDVAQKTAEVTYTKTVAETQAIIGAQLNAAQLGIQSAQMQLDMYTLTAPISGTVEAANVKKNAMVSTGDMAYIISNTDTMTVTYYVSEDVRNTFTIGQDIVVNRNGHDYPGNITQISSMVDPQTGLFQIKASVEGGNDILLAGTSVTIMADTYRETNGLLIPYDAVYYDDGQPYVYCLVDGKAVKSEIQTGIFDDQTMTVLSGLQTDSQVITTWSPNLHDGADVIITANEGK
ncbi:MAG: efflux RND transporter periplasmic adaptor subunit [Lachnospiraceae bacterium]